MSLYDPILAELKLGREWVKEVNLSDGLSLSLWLISLNLLRISNIGLVL